MNNKLLTEKIDDTFKNVLKHLNSIDVKTYRKLIKSDYNACYDSYGEYMGDCLDEVGMINIKYSNLSKFKKDIEREVNLQKDKYLLIMERLLLNKLNF